MSGEGIVTKKCYRNVQTSRKLLPSKINTLICLAD